MGQMQVFLLLALILAIGWVGYSFMDEDTPGNADKRQALPATSTGLPEAVGRTAKGIAISEEEDQKPSSLPATDELTQYEPGSHPGAPILIDENAVGPGGLPADNAYPLAPEAGDPGTSGLGPDACESTVPMPPPEGGEPPASGGSSPEKGGGG